MRAVVTGQIGMDKADYLRQVVDLAGQGGDRIDSFHVGKMMYEEAPDVRDGRILDLPISRLASLRRAAFKDIINRKNKYGSTPLDYAYGNDSPIKKDIVALLRQY